MAKSWLKRPGNGPAVVVPDKIGQPNYLIEDQVGDSDDELVFVGVSSCVAVTCVLADKITGGHFTIGTTPEELKLLLGEWKKLHKTPVKSMYVVGPWEQWGNMKIAKGVDGLVKLFKAELKPGKAWAFDQKPLVDATIRAKYVGTEGASFDILDSKQLKRDKGIIKNFDAFKPIPPAKFVAK